MSPQVADLRELRVKTQGFAGGVNIRDAVDQLGPDELVKCENARLDQRGGLAKRTGSQSNGTFGIGADRGLSSYTYYRPGTNPQVLLHTSAGKLYYTNDPSANPIVWTQITAGLSTTVPCSFETFTSKVFFCEGTTYASWDGTTYVTYPSAPQGRFLRLWKDTMWMSGIASLPDRVYSSAAGDATSWPAGSWVDILKGDGDSVTALASDGLFLIVAKQRRIQVIYDPALFSNRTADFEKGAESHFGWVHMEDKLYFLSRLGICWWQGDTSARLISYKLDPLFRPEILNLGALSSAYAYQIGGICGWALPEAGNTIPTLVIEYYPRLGPIYQISGNIGPGPWVMHRIPASTFCTVRSGSTEYLYGSHNGANKFLWLFAPVGTDDGALFTTTVQTGFYDLGEPIYTKYLRRIKAVGRGKFNLQLKRNFANALYVTKLIDFTQATDNWNSGNWGGGATWGPDANVKEDLINLDAYGRSFALVISDAETTTGNLLLSVGSKDYSLVLGEWSFYEATFDGALLGLRG